MPSKVVRITNIKLKNFKDVRFGEVPWGNLDNLVLDKSDIRGIYGQNGSGKTAVVDALHLLQKILCGTELPTNAEENIRRGETEAEVGVCFLIKEGEKYFGYEYIYTLREVNAKCRVSSEKLLFTELSQKENGFYKEIFSCNIIGESNTFGPKYSYDKFVKDDENNIISFAVAKKMAANTGTSLLFSEEGSKIFDDKFSDEMLSFGVRALRHFAMAKMFVITNLDIGVINMQYLIPINISQKKQDVLDKGTIPIFLQKISLIPKRIYDVLNNSIEPINKVLSTIVPNLRVEINDYGSQLMDDGSDGRKIELISVKEGVKIPLRCESAGVIKIVSILNAIIAMYNDETVCLVVDELDSGIFEYLLGNLLQIIEKNGRGQLLFTSHNLRILETVNKESISFTTVNPENRYISIDGIDKTDNIRDTYLRSLSIGGQKEKLCDDIDVYAIGRAFRLAGRDMMA